MWNKESFGLVMVVQKGNFIAQDDAKILRERIAFLNQKTPTNYARSTGRVFDSRQRSTARAPQI